MPTKKRYHFRNPAYTFHPLPDTVKTGLLSTEFLGLIYGMSKKPEDVVDAIPDWARALAEARTRVGLTQTQLAERLYVSQSSVTDWERGKSRPRARLWSAIRTALDVDMGHWLVGKSAYKRIQNAKLEGRAERDDFLDLNPLARFRRFSRAYWERLVSSGIEMPAPKFAVLVFRIFTMESQTGSLRTLEARLLEAIGDEVPRIVDMRENGEMEPAPTGNFEEYLVDRKKTL